MDKNNDIKQKQMSLEIEPSLVIACGAIARELQFLKQLNKWRYMKIQCLPAELHNRPDEIKIYSLPMLIAGLADYWIWFLRNMV